MTVCASRPAPAAGRDNGHHPLGLQPAPLLTVLQVSDRLGKPKATLYDWRSRGQGPRAIRVGNVLRYQRSDVERWLDERT